MNRLIAGSVTFVFLITAVAQASSAMPHCGNFEVTRGDGQIDYIDVKDDGLGRGDRRIGSYDLIGPDGDVVGE